MNSPPPLLRCEAIRKAFAGVTVLKSLSFELGQGRILGVVGENGAGKSTLVNILGGILKFDGGRMEVDGTPYVPADPREAAQAGIAFVHQELNLFPNLSVAENLFLMDPPQHRLLGLRWLDRDALDRGAAALLKRVALRLSPDMLVERLSPGERQLVEIARALRGRPRLVIFDEPATSLTYEEVDRLLEITRGLKSEGISVIYISHALETVLALCDDLLVLRDGQIVGSGKAAEFDMGRLVTLMVGRSINQLYPPRTSAPSRQVALLVENLSQPGIVADVSFDLHRGEILGIAGLMGSGRSELARILFGLDPYQHGAILLGGEPVGGLKPRELIRRGMAFLTESRREDGLLMEASLGSNLALVGLPGFARPGSGLLRRLPLADRIAEVAAAVHVTGVRDTSQMARSLSGGNQQKAVIGKWLFRRPAVFLLDEPTRGIDIGAKSEVYRLIDQLAADGVAILLISSEIEELLGICDRVLIMGRGQIRGVLERSEFDRERVLRLALGGLPAA